jgi:hypothetical protein
LIQGIHMATITAEIQAQTLKEILGTELVTKKDLTETKVEIIKWVAGMLVAQVAIVAALLKLL